jgi:surfeit locus 1 family protein
MTEPRPLRSRLAFHALTVLAIAVCVLAARWQWDRAHRTEADAVPDAPAIALADLDPRTSFSGMRVSVTGRFDPDHDVLVAPRVSAGQSGAWVVTPLLPSQTGDSEGAADGTAVAVVRGWVPEGQLPGSPPLGEVSVVGILVADSRQPGVAVQGSPPTLTAVDTGALAAHVGYPIRSGWLALQQLQPTQPGQPVALDVTDLPGADVGLNWRNAAYAAQWIVFAGFVVLFWSRFRRELAERPQEQETSR